MNPPSGSSGAGKSAAIAVLALLFIGSLAFGVWSYGQMQDYKTKSDQKSAVAAEAAKKEGAAQLQKQFNEQLKSPYKKFRGSPTYGSITFSYPRSWSAYVDEFGAEQPIDGYFHPVQVPGIQSKTAFALRVEVISSDYSDVVDQLNGQIPAGGLTAHAYIPPKMKNNSAATAGTYYQGKISQEENAPNGSMLVIKVRDKTLKIYTESSDYTKDFNSIVLASLTFAP